MYRFFLVCAVLFFCAFCITGCEQLQAFLSGYTSEESQLMKDRINTLLEEFSAIKADLDKAREEGASIETIKDIASRAAVVGKELLAAKEEQEKFFKNASESGTKNLVFTGIGWLTSLAGMFLGGRLPVLRQLDSVLVGVDRMRNSNPGLDLTLLTDSQKDSGTREALRKRRRKLKIA